MAMDNKVTIIGTTGTGKTTYLTGMYAYMSGLGCKNFTLVTDPNNDLNLSRMWDALESGQFPKASFDAEDYVFHITHNYAPVCDFTWLDYPGGLLMDPSHEKYEMMTKSIATSDCLLFVLDAAKLFAFEASNGNDYREKLEKKLMMNSGVRSELKELTKLSQQGIKIPALCITITKADLIDPEYKNIIESVLSDKFEALFKGSARVIISAVSLGADIEENGADPHCIEEPIAYAVLNILIKYMELLKEKRIAKFGVVTKKRGRFTRWLDSEEIASAQQELKNMEKIAGQWYQDAWSLLDLICKDNPDKSIYVEGKKKSFREYFRQVFAEINEN